VGRDLCTQPTLLRLENAGGLKDGQSHSLADPHKPGLNKSRPSDRDPVFFRTVRPERGEHKD